MPIMEQTYWGLFSCLNKFTPFLLLVYTFHVFITGQPKPGLGSEIKFTKPGRANIRNRVLTI